MNIRHRAPRLVRLLKASMLVLLLSGVAAPAASAVGWNSAGSPLKVTGYGSTVEGYGSWYVSTGSSGTIFKTTTYQRVAVQGDNHKVHADIQNWTNAGICYAPQYTSCTAAYYYYNGDSTESTIKSKWVRDYEEAPVNPSADYGKGRIRMRIDVPWRTDPASGWTLTNGVSY